MASIADFFFIAGLPDDCDFECFAVDNAKERTHFAAEQEMISSLEVTDRDTNLPHCIMRSAERATRGISDSSLSVHAGSKSSSSFTDTPHEDISSDSPRAAQEPLVSTHERHLEDSLGFRTDTFSLRALIDPIAEHCRSFRSAENDSLVIQEASLRSAEEEDQFNDNPTRRFSSGRRERNSVMRRPSNSSALSISRRESRGKTTYGHTEKRQSSTTTKANPRPISQAYSHVIPDPEPLLLPPCTHPLKRKYAPRLLAKYPDRRTSTEGKSSFPEYIPMFSFPDDITVRSGDERPRSSWHGFSLTQGNGQPLHGMCIIIWIPIRDETAKRFEARCAEWRQKYLRPEVWEVAFLLTTRIGMLQARLSKLLRELGRSDAREREVVHEKINDCEEKIAVYTEMLKPVRHGSSSNIAGLTKRTGMWMPRALGILGTEGDLQNTWKSWLMTIGALYMRVDLRNVPTKAYQTDLLLPLERYVVNLCHELPRPPSINFKVEAWICNARIETVREAQNELPGSRNIDLYPLFRSLTIENIVLLFEAALLESRIIFMSSHPSMLSSAATALKSLLYPFQWEGVYIPVLPRRLVSYLDAPTPFIMGIQKQFTPVDLPEGEDVIVCDLDQNSVLCQMGVSLPSDIRLKLKHFLSVASPMHRALSVPYGPPIYCVESFPADSVVRVATPDPFIAPSVADLLVQGSDAFVDIECIGSKKPDHNMFSTSRWETKLRRIMPDVGTTQAADTHRVRPSLKSQFSTFTSSLRGKSKFDKKQAQASLRDFAEPRASTGERASVSSRTTMGLARFLASPPPRSVANSVYTHSSSHRSRAASTILRFDTAVDESIGASHVSDSDLVLREGHEMQYCSSVDKTKMAPSCDYAADVIEGGFYTCLSCQLTISEKYIDCISLPCLPRAFSSNKARAAFARSLASLLPNYRKFLKPTRHHAHKLFSYDLDAHERDCMASGNKFLARMMETHLFASFMDDRCTKPQSDPEIKLFDQILLAKRNRRKSSVFFSGKSGLSFLLDRSAEIKRTFTAMTPNSENLPVKGNFMSGEVPDCLDDRFLCEPRALVADTTHDCAFYHNVA